MTDAEYLELKRQVVGFHDANGAIAKLLAYVEERRTQMAGLALRKEEQVSAVVVGIAGKMPGTDEFTMTCFSASEVPVGTRLYTAPTLPAAQEKVPK